METLIIVILAPVIVLIVFSAVAVLIIRRIQKNHMERLNSRDAEYGTIEGLIASNVGDSTLAVSNCVRGEKPCGLPSLLTPPPEPSRHATLVAGPFAARECHFVPALVW